MDRLACINLPAFPLQLLLKREPLWRERPVAVVKEDKPQAELLWVNERARRAAVLPGMRYAAGLSLASELCAGVVTDEEIETCVAALVERLRRFSPHVEPSEHDPGVFWIDASGLRYLHPTLMAWAQRIHADLDSNGTGFLARIVVGFSRFGTGAIALSRQGPRTIVLETDAQERTRAETVRLDRLRIEPKVRDDLHALGIDTIKDLLRLPPAGLRKRHGQDIFRLHQAAREEWHRPLQPQAAATDFKQHTVLDYPERDQNRLLFLVKRMLDPMLLQLVEQKRALSELTIEMKLDSSGERVEHLRPAEPTIDIRQLLNLAMLRLDAVHLKAGVIELKLDAKHVAASYKQLSLFLQQKKRDLAAAKRAFARLRAEFGDRAVVRAELKDGHLPEACFRWTPLLETKPPRLPRVARRMLVRRILDRPKVLPHRPRHEENGWQLRGRDDPPVEAVLGPYVVSGGWWKRDVHREYHFIRNLKGEWLWVYYDRHRRRWFLQGRVE